jgi:hypothetical protein
MTLRIVTPSIAREHTACAVLREGALEPVLVRGPTPGQFGEARRP